MREHTEALPSTEPDHAQREAARGSLIATLFQQDKGVDGFTAKLAYNRGDGRLPLIIPRNTTTAYVTHPPKPERRKKRKPVEMPATETWELLAPARALDRDTHDDHGDHYLAWRWNAATQTAETRVIRAPLIVSMEMTHEERLAKQRSALRSNVHDVLSGKPRSAGDVPLTELCAEAFRERPDVGNLLDGLTFRSVYERVRKIRAVKCGFRHEREALSVEGCPIGENNSLCAHLYERRWTLKTFQDALNVTATFGLLPGVKLKQFESQLDRFAKELQGIDNEANAHFRRLGTRTPDEKKTEKQKRFALTVVEGKNIPDTVSAGYQRLQESTAERYGIPAMKKDLEDALRSMLEKNTTDPACHPRFLLQPANPHSIDYHSWERFLDPEAQTYEGWNHYLAASKALLNARIWEDKRLSQSGERE